MPLQLTNKVRKFILKTFDEGYITKKSSKMSGFYFVAWHCRDNRILRVDGVDGNNQKKWKLTSKGKRIASLLKQIHEIIEEENNNA